QSLDRKKAEQLSNEKRALFQEKLEQWREQEKHVQQQSVQKKQMARQEKIVLLIGLLFTVLAGLWVGWNSTWWVGILKMIAILSLNVYIYIDYAPSRFSQKPHQQEESIPSGSAEEFDEAKDQLQQDDERRGSIYALAEQITGKKDILESIISEQQEAEQSLQRIHESVLNWCEKYDLTKSHN